MDNNFQTSFIPKKPLAEERVYRNRHVSLFSFLATIIFFGSLASAAGTYFYKASLTKSLASNRAALEAARNSFEPTFITELQKLNKRIDSANDLLNNHIAVSPIFTILQSNTLKSIQFTTFSYSAGADASSPVTINMNGKARDYTSIALESDQLNTVKDIHDPIFSGLTLDEKTSTVAFQLTFNVDPSLVRYVNHLSTSLSDGDISSPVPTVPAGAIQSSPVTGPLPVGGGSTTSGGATPSGTSGSGTGAVPAQ